MYKQAWLFVPLWSGVSQCMPTLLSLRVWAAISLVSRTSSVISAGLWSSVHVHHGKGRCPPFFLFFFFSFSLFFPSHSWFLFSPCILWEVVRLCLQAACCCQCSTCARAVPSSVLVRHLAARCCWDQARFVLLKSKRRVVWAAGADWWCAQPVRK